MAVLAAESGRGKTILAHDLDGVAEHFVRIMRSRQAKQIVHSSELRSLFRLS